MATYVPVPGGWRWTPVVRHPGRRAYTPTLPGHDPDAERAGTTMTDCVASLTRYVEQRDLRDVVPVGHSLGGGVLTQVCASLGDGECTNDAIPPQNAERSRRWPPRQTALPWEVRHAGLWLLSRIGGWWLILFARASLLLPYRRHAGRCADLWSRPQVDADSRAPLSFGCRLSQKPAPHLEAAVPLSSGSAGKRHRKPSGKLLTGQFPS